MKDKLDLGRYLDSENNGSPNTSKRLSQCANDTSFSLTYVAYFILSSYRGLNYSIVLLEFEDCGQDP